MKLILPILLLLSSPAMAMGDYDDFYACSGTNCWTDRFTVYSADEIRALGAAQYCFVGNHTWHEQIGPEQWKKRGREDAFMLVEDCKKRDHMKPEQSWNHPNPALDRAEGMDHTKYTGRQWCWYSDAHCTPSQRYLNEVKNNF